MRECLGNLSMTILSVVKLKLLFKQSESRIHSVPKKGQFLTLLQPVTMYMNRAEALFLSFSSLLLGRRSQNFHSVYSKDYFNNLNYWNMHVLDF